MKKKGKLNIEIELPFSGIIDTERCYGIRSAGKLYTQCLNYTNENVTYCNACEKQSKKNESGKPNHGSIEDRMSVGLYEFKDINGQNPWPYWKLMRKHKWTKEYVLEVANKHNVIVSDEHFNVHSDEQPKKYNPKKSNKQNVESKEKEEKVEEKKVVEKEEKVEEKKVAEKEEKVEEKKVAEKEVKVKKVEEKKLVEKEEKVKKVEEKVEEKKVEEKKKRKGRPSKANKSVIIIEEEEEEETEDEQKNEEMKELRIEDYINDKEEIVEEEVVEEDVIEFKFNGKTYYRAVDSGIVYNCLDDPEVIGMWDQINETIVECRDGLFDEEEEEEEE